MSRMEINKEDYFQINSDILASFPKYRLPLNLYTLKEDIAVLEQCYKKGTRMNDADVEALAQLCANGNVFVARSDQDIYRKHMLRQLDLVLLDPNLTVDEIAELCIAAAIIRYQSFYDQPVPDLLDLLYRDIMVITEYLWGNKERILAFTRRIFHQSKPAKHAVNTMIIGAWLWLNLQTETTRKEFDRVILAFLLHDIGMSKIPDFILNKRQHLNPDERDKIEQHPIISVKIMHKSDLKFDELVRACFEHHERLDGSGYPQRSKGDQISTIGRITAVADSFSAMISERCYAKAKDLNVASSELARDGRYDKNITSVLANAMVADGPFSNPIDMDKRIGELVKD